MIYIADKIANYLIYIFLLHFCFRIEFRKSKVCIFLSGLTCIVAGLVDIYVGVDTFFVYIIWCILAVELLFDEKKGYLAALTLALTWFMGMIDTFSLIVVQIAFFGKAVERESLEWWQLGAYIISFLIEYGMYFWVLKKNSVYLDDIKLTYKINLLVMTYVYELVVVNVFGLYYRNPSEYSWYLHIRFAICFFGIIFSLASILKLAVRNFLYDAKNRELTLALNMQQNQYLYQKEKNVSLRRFRHDLINHIGAVQEMLSQKQYENAKTYIEKIWKVTENLSVKYSCGDDYMDAILNYYQYLCDKENIKFEVSGKLLYPIEMDGMDTTTILGNALQNAIEATKLVENKYIKVEIVDRGKEVFVSVKNTCGDISITPNLGIKTSKADKENHGFGLNNIVSAVKKYKGEYYLSVDKTNQGNMFTLDISMILRG